MRIHTDKFRASAVADALAAELLVGRIAPHVTFKVLVEHGSRLRDFAIEIQLEAEVRDSGRRAGNSGSYGAMIPEHDGYAATYDEWGWLLAALYEIDKDMVVGAGMANAIYDSRVTFDHKTGMTYNPGKLLPLLEAGYWPSFIGRTDYDGGDPYPVVVGRGAQTKRGYFVGRYGAGRTTLDQIKPYWPHLLKPRTPDEYRAFAHPVAVTA